MDLRALLLETNGRIGRKDFWLGTLILYGASIVLNLMPFVGFLWVFGFIYCFACVAGKRLHDIGLTHMIAVVFVPIMSISFGIFGALLFFAVMGGGLDLGPVKAEDSATVIASALGICTIMQFGFIVWLGTKPSDPGANRFGPPPVPLDATGR